MERMRARDLSLASYIMTTSAAALLQVREGDLTQLVTCEKPKVKIRNRTTLYLLAR